MVNTNVLTKNQLYKLCDSYKNQFTIFNTLTLIDNIELLLELKNIEFSHIKTELFSYLVYFNLDKKLNHFVSNFSLEDLTNINIVFSLLVIDSSND